MCVPPGFAAELLLIIVRIFAGKIAQTNHRNWPSKHLPGLAASRFECLLTSLFFIVSLQMLNLCCDSTAPNAIKVLQ